MTAPRNFTKFEKVHPGIGRNFPRKKKRWPCTWQLLCTRYSAVL